MTINLKSYTSIATALFVTIDVPGFEVLNFTDYNRSLTLNSVAYTGLGQLVGITNTSSELKTSNNQLTITVSGIQNTNIADLLAHKVKGSSVEVWRGIFDAQTMQLVSVQGNPIGRFQGIVNNYTLDETFDGQTATNTIGFICTSNIGLLQSKMAGRRTNPLDQRALYPTDLSMNRVPSIANSNLNFGAP